MLMCCGEALIDMLPRKNAAREDCFSPYAGGSVFNTAIALGRLEAPTGLVSGIGRDMFGQILSSALDDSGVDRSHVLYTDRPTTLAFVQLVDGQAQYQFYDENSAGRMLDPDRLPEIPMEVQAMFFGGISLVAEPCGSFYEALMKREAGARVTMIDPNIRPRFIADETSYRARLTRMMSWADIVKLSDEDLLWLTGERDIVAGAREILDAGTSVVFVTEGANGAHAVTANDRAFLSSRKVDVVDTVGAGDTFNAGILAALWRSDKLAKPAVASLGPDDLRAALDLATRCAAVTVSRAGANPPWAKEI